MNRPLFKALFDKPKIIGVVGDINQGKTMLLGHMITELREVGKFNLYTYGFRVPVKNSYQVYTIEEIEKIKNSVIIIDEVMTLFDFDNRIVKRQIENTLRLIHHNNNILVLCFVPENVKKFVAGKLNVIFFKQVTFADFINGSKTKHIVTNYKGFEGGTSILNLNVNESLLFDGEHYHKIYIPLIPSFDSKKKNLAIISEVTKC